jgi:hypothetical protein
MYLRKYKIQNGEVRLLCHHELQASGAVQGGPDVIPTILQVLAIAFEQSFVEIDKYDPAGHANSGNQCGLT